MFWLINLNISRSVNNEFSFVANINLRSNRHFFLNLPDSSNMKFQILINWLEFFFAVLYRHALGTKKKSRDLCLIYPKTIGCECDKHISSTDYWGLLYNFFKHFHHKG